MSSFLVLLDACVLYPASLRDTLIRAGRAGFYQPYWTDQILDEAVRNLIKDGRVTKTQAEHLISQMKKALPAATIPLANYASLIPAMENDPGDRHVLAAAVANKVQVIVTSNLKHFPDSVLEKYNVEAQSPDEFLVYQSDFNPQLMAAILEEQAKNLKKPPVSVEQLMEALGKQVPDFVKFIRSYLNLP